MNLKIQRHPNARPIRMSLYCEYYSGWQPHTRTTQVPLYWIASTRRGAGETSEVEHTLLTRQKTREHRGVACESSSSAVVAGHTARCHPIPPLQALLAAEAVEVAAAAVAEANLTQVARAIPWASASADL